MAIIYNGRPVTAAIYDDSVYRSISYNGCVAYVNTCVCWRSNAYVHFAFKGFDYSTDGLYFCARAKACIMCTSDNDAYISWASGSPLANSIGDLDLCIRSMHHMSCTCLLYQGRGYCGTNYNFTVTGAPFEIGKADSDDEEYFGLGLPSNCTCARGSDYGFIWRFEGCCCLYGDWVRISRCDYQSGLTCTGSTVIRRPIIYLRGIEACYSDPLYYAEHCYFPVQGNTGSCTNGIVNIEIC